VSAQRAKVVFLFSLLAWPAAFAAGVAADLAVEMTRACFVLTLLVEAIALVLVFGERRRFAPGEPGRRVWTLFAGFAVLRMLAQLRLLTLYFGWVPEFVAGNHGVYLFYIAGLRFLYTASDLLFAAALVISIRNVKSTGLPFATGTRDYGWMALICIIPAGALILHHTMAVDTVIGTGAGLPLMVFRLVAVTLGTIIACLCIVVRRYAVQMGGGALAGVWSMLVLAGISHTASFVVFASLAVPWPGGADFFEQLFLWIFACAWLLALLRQRTMTAGVPGEG